MSRLAPLLIVVAVMVSGAVILVVEILGTRLLAPIYGTTIYVWSGLITVTLVGLAVGYMLGGRVADRLHSPRSFSLIFMLAGFSLYALLTFRAAILLFSEQYGVATGPLIASMLLFTIPLILLGMVDPYAIRLQTKQLGLVGTGAGSIFGFSTIGGLIGALTAAYVLLPAFTLSQIFLSVSILLCSVGVIGIILTSLLPEHRRSSLHAVVIVGILMGLLYGTSLYGHRMSTVAIAEHPKRFGQAKILYESQNLYSLNRVIATPNEYGIRCFSADGGLQTCIDPNNKDEVGYTAKMGLFIKALPTNSRMLLLGMGGGKIIKEQGRTDIDTDIVDINPATFYAAQKYMGVTLSPRQKTYLMDGRRFLGLTKQKYDLVLIDVSTTLTPPAHLYTKEFFALVRDHLTPQGVAIFQLTDEHPETSMSFQSLLATVRSVLPYTYADHDGVVTLLVMGTSDEADKIRTVNTGVRKIQKEYSAYNAVHEFRPITLSAESKAMIFTDDHNLVDYYWRDKILLFKRFNLLLKEDVS